MTLCAPPLFFFLRGPLAPLTPPCCPLSPPHWRSPLHAVAEIFKGVGDAIGKRLNVPKDLAAALESEETLAMLQVRVVDRSANERFTEGSVHGGSRSGRAGKNPSPTTLTAASPTGSGGSS